MIKQVAIYYPNTFIIKEFYEYLDDELIYMEETDIEETYSYGLDFYLEEYKYK